jgi:hypothetical protein
LEHVAKGDPRDVAAYCAFLWHHGERTAAQPEPASADADVHPDFARMTTIDELAQAIVHNATSEADHDDPAFLFDVRDCLIRAQQLSASADAEDAARPKREWHEDYGPVVWWAWCGAAWAGEPAWIGTPNDSDWPGYHTHWTPHPAMPPLRDAARAAKGGE